jgi:predicted DsbA family dithiol-disulfide isomerase
MRVDIWSDLVCPWCYIGKRRFETALAAFPDREHLQVVHRAFQLDPSMPKGRLFRHRDVLMRKYGMSEAQVAAAQARLEGIAAAEGLEYHLADSHTGNTLDAHRLVHHAAAGGIQDAVIERSLAAEAGLPDANMVLAGELHADAVRADHQQANALGANGVPLFLFDGRYSVSGAQSADVFAQALSRLVIP